MSATKAAMTLTLPDVEKLIHDRVHKICVSSKFAWDREDATAIAMGQFVEAMHTYVSGKCKFTTWLTHMIRFGFLNEIRAYKRMQCYRPRSWDLPTHLSAKMVVDEDGNCVDYQRQNRQSLEGFIFDELTEDAAAVAWYVINMPKQMRAWCYGVDHHSKEAVPIIIAALRDYLTDLGWSEARIETAFEQIRTALA